MPLIIPRRHRPSYASGYARSASQAKNPGLRKGLVGLWDMSLGATGNTLHDVARKNNGTLVNDPTWVPSPNGGALELDPDGVGDEHIVFADSTATHGTLFIRHRRTAAYHNAGFLGWFPTAGSDSRVFTTTDQRVFWRFYDTSDNSNQSNAHLTILNQWYNYCLVTTPGRYDWYIDGVLFYTDTPDAGTFRPWYMKYLGWDGASSGQTYAGELETTSIWNRALLPSEIIELNDPHALTALRDSVLPFVSGAPPAGTANPLVMGATNLMAGKLAV